SAGIERSRIIVDPGLGFGKTAGHNLDLLARLDEIVALGVPVLVGASRKSFIGQVTGVEAPDERLAGSLACAVWAVGKGAVIVRAHDVASTVQAVGMVRSLETRQQGNKATRQRGNNVKGQKEEIESRWKAATG
ncbi:MAG: dihydropteroate synthase, partial [Phycisphaerae bacterium]